MPQNNTPASGNPYVKAFTDLLATSKNVFGFLSDPAERQGIRQGVTDAVNRGAVAATLGAPVDMANTALNLGKAAVGYVGNKTGLLSADQMPQLIDNPVGGSEYIGNQMQRFGMVSPNRNALAEGIAGILPMSPSTSGKAVAAIAGGGLVPGVESAMFIGPNAKTWNGAAARRALDMEKAGADPKEIWSKTGTFRGADGRLRQEIDDSASKLQAPNREAVDFMSGQGPSEYPVGSVSNVLSHPEMTVSYPDAMAIKSRLVKGESGAYIAKTGFGEGFDLPAMFKDGNYQNPKRTQGVTLHELQHAVQQREGFSMGGSMDDFVYDAMQVKQNAMDRVKTINDELRTAMGTPRYQALMDERQRLVPLVQKDVLDIKEEAFQNYRRLAGEAEARATQARMNMTPEQRRAMFPYESYDVPVNQLIIRR